MAPVAVTAQTIPSKIKRPIPPGIQTNGINSSTSSPSPSMSTGRLPNSAKNPPSSATSNGFGTSLSTGPRSANRVRRDPSSQLLGRGQRNASGGGRLGGVNGDLEEVAASEPTPYVLTDEYILKKYRGHQPSLVIHLHPTHFRFDNQEGSFTYKSPMRIVIEHLRTRTIPHDLIELMEDVPVYEGCMIVQVHDHKTIAPATEQGRQSTSVGKTTPFSVHNYNTFLTPSPYVPYPKQNSSPGRGSVSDDGNDTKLKSVEQKDKENMPAPAIPGDANRNKLSTIPRKPKISTIVLHPTPLSDHFSVTAKAAELITSNDARRESRSDAPLSATVPPTPNITVPPTPGFPSMPSSKRLKKSQAEAATSRVYEAEMHVLRTTATPLILQTVNSAMESAELLKILAQPMHIDKPPSPKSRKRTVAEMAADEALAADQERYMLLLDERLAASAAGAPGANPGDGTAQAGSGSFEPRFERFKVLANIRVAHEEKLRQDKINAEARDRKNQQDKERERLQKESEARELAKAQSAESQRQAVQMQAARAQELQRRQLAAQAQAHAQNMQNMPGQGQHAHPQANNNIMANGVQGQPQRFHQQQTQAQVSSPIPRNGTPQNHSSPMAASMANVPMQHSNSNMGGSPARPGSVVHQNHTPMGAPAMAQQRSQQSHSGTPRMPSATPNLQNTPLNRPMNQTPRMNQAGPLPGQMQQSNGMILLQNGQQITQLQHQQMLQAQANRNRMAQAQASAMAQQNGQMMNGANNPAMQHQLQMLQQQRAVAAMGGNPNYNPQMAAAMAARQAQAGNMMNGNFMSPGGQNMPQQLRMDPAQIQAMQQMQQANIQRAAQAQAQQAAVSQQAQAQQAFAQQVMRMSSNLYQEKVQAYAQQYPQGIPEDIDRQLKVHCQQQASIQIRQRRQQIVAQQQQQQAQQQQMMATGMGNMNNMGNGMGM